MNHAVFRFFDELNDFLSPSQRGSPDDIAFNERQSVKHLFESLGVPHTEVGQVLVSGQPAEFSYLARDGDQIDLHPFTPAQRGSWLRQDCAGFLLDVHLGKLARRMRLLGLDTAYSNQISDQELAAISETERRILLTRDRRLLMRKQVAFGYCIRDLKPARQILEVLKRFDLFGELHPFQRCPLCNTMLEAASKQDVIERLEPLTRRYFEEFRRCPGCGQVYWEGSHVSRMRSWIEREINV